MRQTEGFPVQEIAAFYERSHIAIKRSAKNSMRLVSKNYLKFEEISEFLVDVFPQVSVSLYGSFCVGNGNHFSDMDISVENFKGTRQNMIKILEKKMRSDQDWIVTFALLNATIPLLRCFHIPTRTKCEIAFDNDMGVVNSHLLRHLFEIQPEMLKFMHFIRIWGNICNFNFKRYQITLLVIFFLQQMNLMPSIKRVQKNLEEAYIENWAVQFNPKRTLMDYGCKKMRYFKNHLKDFFEFYATFDFDSYVIYPNTGQPVLKDDYPHQRFPMNQTRNWKKPMAMASLMSMDYNVTYDVGADRLKKFVRYCQMTEQLFDNNSW